MSQCSSGIGPPKLSWTHIHEKFLKKPYLLAAIFGHVTKSWAIGYKQKIDNLWKVSSKGKNMPNSFSLSCRLWSRLTWSGRSYRSHLRPQKRLQIEDGPWLELSPEPHVAFYIRRKKIPHLLTVNLGFLLLSIVDL